LSFALLCIRANKVAAIVTVLELVLDVYDMLVDKVDVLVLLIHDKLSFLHVGINTDLVVVNLH